MRPIIGDRRPADADQHAREKSAGQDELDCRANMAGGTITGGMSPFQWSDRACSPGQGSMTWPIRPWARTVTLDAVDLAEANGLRSAGRYDAYPGFTGPRPKRIERMRINLDVGLLFA